MFCFSCWCYCCYCCCCDIIIFVFFFLIRSFASFVVFAHFAFIYFTFSVSPISFASCRAKCYSYSFSHIIFFFRRRRLRLRLLLLLFIRFVCLCGGMFSSAFCIFEISLIVYFFHVDSTLFISLLSILVPCVLWIESFSQRQKCIIIFFFSSHFISFWLYSLWWSACTFSPSFSDRFFFFLFLSSWLFSRIDNLCYSALLNI